MTETTETLAGPISDTPLPQRPRLNKMFRLQWEPAQEAHVLLYPEGMVKLNQSAAEILKRCDGERTLAQLIADIEQAFGEKDLRDPVMGMLRTAYEQDWIQ